MVATGLRKIINRVYQGLWRSDFEFRNDDTTEALLNNERDLLVLMHQLGFMANHPFLCTPYAAGKHDELK